MGAHLSGPDSVWFGHLISDNSPCIQPFPLFIQDFSRNFSDPSEVIRARAQIRILRQGSISVAAYAAEFKTLSRDGGYDQLALVDQFFRGLNDIVMNFMIMADLSASLERNIDNALRIDNRLASRNTLLQNRPEFTPYTSRGVYRAPNPPLAASKISSVPQNSRQIPATASAPGYLHMEIDTVTSRFRPPLTTEEKKKRRELGVCLYCGQPSHIIPN
ncbi:Retrotransposon-derived protein PEG10 [Smittium culicis]|uniref:Retrotransposon-derived protein PEG10 n=1 Tax=Smittium culicis TaxID=133412 RepID=A0A1R1X1B1_9FUNG|nr:Retrotransposon-derived protein PEG10 [Smittium culicis]